MSLSHFSWEKVRVYKLASSLSPSHSSTADTVMHKSIKTLKRNLSRSLSRSDATVENCLDKGLNSLKELQSSITAIPSFLVSNQHLLEPKPDSQDVIQDDREDCCSRKSSKSEGNCSRKSSSINSNMRYAKRDSSIDSYLSSPSYGTSRRSSHCPSLITAEQFEVDSA